MIIEDIRLALLAACEALRAAPREDSGSGGRLLRFKAIQKLIILRRDC